MMQKSYTWDVFICHATEDKNIVATPLYDQLCKNGLNVWYDEVAIGTGQKISEAVIDGVNRTRLIVMILSNASITKPWPWIEQGARLNKAKSEEPLFPLRYGISCEKIITSIALFSDIKIAEINPGNIEQIAVEITEKVREMKSKAGRERKRKKALLFLCLPILAGLLFYYLFTNFSSTGNTLLSSNPESIKQAGKTALPVSQKSKKSEPATNKQTSSSKNNTLSGNKAVKDYTAFLNSSVKNSEDKTDVCVTVINRENKIDYTASGKIATIYSDNGYFGKAGLLKSSFIGKPQFNQLWEGDHDIIENIKLSNYTDYLVLGKISFNQNPGTLVNGTVVSSASVSVNIISSSNGLVRSFTVSANGNGVTSPQAREDALNKLFYKYSQTYSSI